MRPMDGCRHGALHVSSLFYSSWVHRGSGWPRDGPAIGTMRSLCRRKKIIKNLLTRFYFTIMITEMPKMTEETGVWCECLKCRHRWLSAVAKAGRRPAQCVNCKRVDWDKPRKVKAVVKRAVGVASKKEETAGEAEARARRDAPAGAVWDARLGEFVVRRKQ